MSRPAARVPHSSAGWLQLVGSRRELLDRLGLAALAMVLGVLVLLPLLRLQVEAFSNGADAYRRVPYVHGLAKTLSSTLWLTLGALAISLVLGTYLAWAAMRLPRRFRWMSALPLIPITIPFVAVVSAWSFLLDPGPGYVNGLLRKLPFITGPPGPLNVFTAQWIIIITGIALSSFVYLFVRASLRNMNQELFEAAQVAGSSPSGAFFKIALPLLRPAIIYGGSMVMLMGLGQITAPLLLGTREGYSVLTTDIRQFATYQTPADYPMAAALGSPLLLVGIGIVLFQGLALGDMNRFISTGGKSFRASLRPSRMAPIAVGLFSIVTLVLPLLALLRVSLSTFWTGKLDLKSLTLATFAHLFSIPDVLNAVTNSVTFSLVTVLLALPLGFVIASILRRQAGNRVVRKIIDLLVLLPLGVPAVLFGVGFLYAYSQPPLILYGTPLVVILVYVTLMLPFTTRLQLSGLASLGSAYEEASRTSGAGMLRAKLTIVVPLMRSTLGAAAALMFVLASQEFSASLLVRSGSTSVMGTTLFDLWDTSGSYPTIAAMALLMTGVTVAGVALALVAGRDVFDRI